MQILNKREFCSFKTLARSTQEDLHKTLSRILISTYPKESVVSTEKYIYAVGDIPVCLLAHMDTVFTYPPTEIFYDKEANVIWSPQGLGADDRAGVFSILKILNAGYRPHIIFTTDEEIGGLGAEVISAQPCPFEECLFMIELDRANQNDCVFYDCDNTEFEDFIESYGFETHMGTFSDISTICPRWGVAGVNLSVGYRNEHSASEVLFVRNMLDTIEKVKHILEDVKNNIVTSKFDYISLRYDMLNYMCHGCKKILPSFMMIPTVASKEGNIIYLCTDCAVEKDIKWCSECGQAILPDVVSEDGLCPDCEEDGDYDDGDYDWWRAFSSGFEKSFDLSSFKSDNGESGFYAEQDYNVEDD